MVFSAAAEAGRESVAADFQCPLEMARATGHPHDKPLMASLGARPAFGARACRLWARWRRAYLHGVNAEHQGILDAIETDDPEPARAAMPSHLANSCERRRRAAARLQQAAAG